MATPKTVKHGGTTWKVMYSYANPVDGTTWYALSLGGRFCTLPARHCNA